MRLDFPNVNGDINIYMDVMRAICGDTNGKSMIDLCCHKAPNTPQLGFSSRRYFDIIDQKLDHKEEQKFFSQEDVLNLTEVVKYDVSFCLDGIEHLTIFDGKRLIQKMMKISTTQIIFTPTTDLFGMAEDNNKDPEAHRSLWNPEAMKIFASIVFPDYHKIWNGGAFFAWRNPDINYDFERVKQILLTKPWAK